MGRDFDGKIVGAVFYEILQKSNSYIAEVMEARKDTCSDSELSSLHLPEQIGWWHGNISFAVPLPSCFLSYLSLSHSSYPALALLLFW